MKFLAKILIMVFVSITALGCSTLRTDTEPTLGSYKETGKASYYSTKHQLKKTASGELYNSKLKTAAHKKLAFGTRVKVTNIKNGKSVVVRVNDRGPYVPGRVIDLSRSAFISIANLSSGIISVELEVVE